MRVNQQTYSPRHEQLTHEEIKLHKVMQKMRSELLSTNFVQKTEKVEMIIMEDMIDAPISIVDYYKDGKEYLIVGLDKGGVQMYDMSKIFGSEPVNKLNCVRKVCHFQIVLT